MVKSQIVYSVAIGGEKVFSYTNSRPSEFEDVKVYAASNWYTPVSGSIKNLLIQNKNDGEWSYFQQQTVVLIQVSFIQLLLMRTAAWSTGFHLTPMKASIC